MRALAGLVLVGWLLMACDQPQQVQKAVEQDLPATRIERARGDAQTIAGAIQQYATLFGTPPDSLAELTAKTTKEGIAGGPFLRVLPSPPPGWSEYRYERRTDGTFVVSAAGDGTTVTAP